MKKKCGTHFLAILKLPRIRAKNWIFCRVLDVFVRCFSQICKQGTEYFLTLQTRTPNIPEKRYFPGKTVFLKILFCCSKAEFSQRADSKIHTRNSRVYTLFASICFQRICNVAIKIQCGVRKHPMTPVK